PGEDIYPDGKIEAGNILSVAPDTGTSANTVTTDKNGFALFWVYYPQEDAQWLEVALNAQVTGQSTEITETTKVVPPVSSHEFTSQTNVPPGLFSPFGFDGVCATPHDVP